MSARERTGRCTRPEVRQTTWKAQATPDTPAGRAKAVLALPSLLCLLFAAGMAASGVAGLPVDRRAIGTARVKSGTGFFVSRNGFVVTSAHVVAGCRGASIWAQDGAERAAQIVASDPMLDVALLAAGAAAPGYFPVVNRGNPHAGEEVVTLGFGVLAAEPLKPIVTAGAFVGDSRTSHGLSLIHI